MRFDKHKRPYAAAGVVPTDLGLRSIYPEAGELKNPIRWLHVQDDPSTARRQQVF